MSRPRALGYVRVSTTDQVEGFGLDVQRRAIADYCKAKELRLVRVFADEGVSGSNGLETRRGLADLVSAAEQPEITELVVYRLDRLARDLVLQETTMARMKRAGVEVLSVSEPDIDSDDPTRVMIRQVLGAISQHERALIRSRMAAGKAAKAAQGGYTGGGPPFGWRAVGGDLVPDEAEQAVVRRIHGMHAQGLSLRKIAESLTQAGLKPRRGGPWHPMQVSTILGRNPA